MAMMRSAAAGRTGVLTVQRLSSVPRSDHRAAVGNDHVDIEPSLNQPKAPVAAEVATQLLPGQLIKEERLGSFAADRVAEAV